MQVDTRNSVTSEVLCEMCEFAVKVIDERLGDAATVDQVRHGIKDDLICVRSSERFSLFAATCQVLSPTSVSRWSTGEQLQEPTHVIFRYGEQLIEALIKKEMDPKMVNHSFTKA